MPQVSRVSTPVPRLLPFLLILLLQWPLFLTVHFYVNATSDSSSPGVPPAPSQDGSTPGQLGSSAVAPEAAGPCHQEVFAVIAFIAT